MSPQNDLEDRLSPRAREMLNSLLTDLRDQTLRSASDRSIGGEIGVRDIVEAFTDQTRSTLRFSSERYRRIERLLVVYAAISAVLVVGTLLVVQFRPEVGSSTQLLAAVGSVSAALVAASVTLLFQYRSRASREVEQLEVRRQAGRTSTAFVDRWTYIEVALRLLAADALGDSVAEEPLGRVIDQLRQAEALDRDELDQVRDLLSIRNEIVHGKAQDVDVEKAIQDADRTLIRLERRLDR